MVEVKGPERKVRDIKELDIRELFLNVPLYESITFTEADRDRLSSIEFFEGTIDCYCIDCAKMSVFKAIQKEEKHRLLFENRPYLTSTHNYKHIFLCSRNPFHSLIFYFKISDFRLIKIGQFPSIADLASYDIQKYRGILHKEVYKEFSRAVGLVSHGIGIGAFVYLRRIFEGLILGAHGQAKTKTDWDEDVYLRSRMDEKINLLKDFLPSFMVEHKNLYSILSKGIHELSEEECLGAFPILKAGIEMILDEKIREQERQAKEAEARKAISKLTGELKGS